MTATSAFVRPARTGPTRPTLTGSFGMVASTHWLGSAAGQSVLERGGNAFDAAAAAAFVLFVVEPHLNGPGGDIVALFAPGGGSPRVLMGQGPAPAGATIDRFRELGLDAVPGAGALATAVPGSVEAWLRLLRDHGTWEFADVVAPARHYAEHGHRLSPAAATVIETMAPHFLAHWATSASVWLRADGSAPRAGDLLCNPALARTLERLGDAAAGADRRERYDAVLHEWKQGFVAEAMVAAAAAPHRHSSGHDLPGVLSRRDLSAPVAAEEQPVTRRFRGYDVLKPGLWTQGPMLLQALMILDHVDGSIDPGTAEGIHAIVETLKLVMADRDAYYGDGHGDRADEVLDHLLSDGYAEARARLIGSRASHEFRPGSVPGVAPFVPELVSAPEVQASAAVGEPTVRPSGETRGDTVHIDVVDQWGNMMSATQSGGWLQSSPAIRELGFSLGTRMQMTWLDESAPSRLEPGRRPRTTLSPTLLVREGQVVAALGTPGGDQQDQWQLLYLLRTIVGGFTPQEAIDAPTFHTTSHVASFWPRTFDPGGVVIEGRVADEVVAELRARGHVVSLAPPWSLGRMSTVTRDPQTGEVSSAANPRGDQGYAVGR